MAAVLAFLTAALVATVSVPWARRLAAANDFVDHPAERKIHTEPIPYLGGIPIIAAVLVALLVGGSISMKMGVAAMAAAGLGIVGLLDDDRTLPPRHRLLYQTLGGLAVLAVGVQVHVTGVVLLDAALTVVWVVGITNAINLLDNMDGLAGGTATVTGAAVAVLAHAAGQTSVARLAAAVSGACLGFLIYNRRPASIYMGDTGSLFLGFLLAVVVLEVDPGLTSPATFVVPLLLLSLPVLDTTTVVVSRLRRDRRVDAAGQDHLSHRLVQRGVSPGTAVVVLVLTEALLGLLAVLAGRAIVPLPIIAATAVMAIGALSLFTAASDVYDEPVVGLPVRPAVLIIGLGVVLAVCVTPAALAMIAARNPATLGVERARDGLTLVQAGDREGATVAFREAAGYLRRADDRLNKPMASFGLAIPVLNSNLRAARAVVGVSRDLVASGEQVIRQVDPTRLRVDQGGVAVDEVRRATPVFIDAAKALADGYERVREARQPYLVPPLAHAVDILADRLSTATVTADRAAEAARLVPAIMGEGGTRRYFLAIQNNAELRGTGGFIGNFGELTATDGRLELTRFGRFEELRDANPAATRELDVPEEFRLRHQRRVDNVLSWAHINISPDFPTTARLITQLYPQSGGQPIDGVIAVDPQGLAALLELTGPISVAAWPEPITSANLVDVTLREQYERFEGDPDDPGAAARADFLGDVGRATWTAVTSTNLGQPERIASLLSTAVRQRHLQLFMQAPKEAALVDEIGASGRTPPLDGDSLLVVNHNGAGNKADYFLSREFRYDVRVEPGRNEARVRANLGLTFRNGTPSSGLPNAVIGPYDSRFAAGENLSLLSIYTPSLVRQATLGEDEIRLGSNQELGRYVHAGELDMPSKATAEMQLRLDGRVPLQAGWYYLDVIRQPTVRPDKVEVRIEVAPGWRIVDTLGVVQLTEQEAARTLVLDRDTRVGVQLRRTGLMGMWDRLVR